MKAQILGESGYIKLITLVWKLPVPTPLNTHCLTSDECSTTSECLDIESAFSYSTSTNMEDIIYVVAKKYLHIEVCYTMIYDIAHLNDLLFSSELLSVCQLPHLWRNILH